MTESLVYDHASNLFEQAGAVFNQARTHRYALTRRWDATPAAVFLMLNPSTADAFRVDNTVRRCISFARREGCGGLVVLNLFAYRSTDPQALKTCLDPVGERNDEFIRRYTANAPLVVTAWGVQGGLRGRAQAVAGLLGDVDLYCFGTTADGSPRHPLYVAGAAPLLRWPEPTTAPRVAAA